MTRVSQILLCAAFSILLTQTASCMNNNIDMTPVAKAGDEIISRAFLSYTASKLGLKKTSKEKKTELLQKIIENIAIANRARSIGLHLGNDFSSDRDVLIFQTRLEYVCTVLKFKENCVEKLFHRVAASIALRLPNISWEKVFIKKEAEFIPYGGKIPKSHQPRKESRQTSINHAYTDTITIVSRGESLTLSRLLLSLNDDDFLKFFESTNDDYTNILQNLLLKRYISNFIVQLPDAQKALLSEIEQRAEQNLLVELYREHIGFERISGGKSSSVIYPVAENEMREFYEKNIRLFEEPEWVEISHIRLRDFDKAVKLKKNLDDNPNSFCAIAREHSIADDASQCGYIGIVKRANKLPLFKEFAFTMSREGEISRPFLADGFAEIVKLHKRKTRILSFNDPHVRKLVIEAIQPIKREEKLRKTIEEEKRNMHIEILKHAL